LALSCVDIALFFSFGYNVSNSKGPWEPPCLLKTYCASFFFSSYFFLFLLFPSRPYHRSCEAQRNENGQSVCTFLGYNIKTHEINVSESNRETKIFYKTPGHHHYNSPLLASSL
jgi:hypothetical protein